MKLLSDAKLQTIESHLDQTAKRLLMATGLSSMGELMHQYVLLGGKRIRPQLAIWTYHHSAGVDEKITDAALLDVAAAWEFFHAFLLIHDDIIDGSSQRRSKSSLHRQLQGLDHNSPRFGLNLGIVAGDLMYAASQRILADLDVPADRYRGLHRLFAEVAAITGFGQAVDILQSHTPLGDCDEQTLLREYHWKTAAYTFEGPMLSAAILAGLSEAARNAISRFALSLGQAYQLQNDLSDLATPAAEGCDLLEGKRTLTLLRARAEMSTLAQTEFDTRIASLQQNCDHRLEVAESLRLALLRTGAVLATSQTIDCLLNASREATEDDALPLALRDAMHQLLDVLRRKYFQPAIV